MNPLEIYKLLPRDNCGECSAKTCMAFAVSLCANPDSLQECRRIAGEAMPAIRSMLQAGGWKDELIKSLMDEVSGLQFDDLAQDIGCFMRDDKLIVRCIGQDYAISKDGTVSPDTGNKWINILLLHYVRNRGRGRFTGKWVSFSELKGGFVKVSTFQRECEEPLRMFMDEDPPGAAIIFGRLGASRAEDFSADQTWSLDLLPKVRALILYRREDDEFPSSLKMIFDGITMEFIDVETLIFLCEGLVHTVRMMKRS